jgi:hypothetical protein
MPMKWRTATNWVPHPLAIADSAIPPEKTEEMRRWAGAVALRAIPHPLRRDLLALHKSCSKGWGTHLLPVLRRSEPGME